MSDWEPPETVEMVGGPYDGVVFIPELDMSVDASGGPELLETVIFCAVNLMYVNGQYGPAAYLMESGQRWSYYPKVLTQLPPPSLSED